MSDLQLGEQRHEVRTYLVTLQCSRCLAGEMERCGGVTLMSSPPQHPHRCNRCGDESHVVGGVTYPSLRWERI